MLKPSIDLVIPVYNNAPQLAELIPHLKAWVVAHEELSVLIVDDGSKDDFQSSASEVEKVDRINVVIRNCNGGRAAACNSGITSSNADYIAILDVDCIPDNCWYARFTEEIASGADCIFTNLSATGNSFWSRYTNDVYRSRRQDYEQGKMNFSTGFCAFRRSILVEVGGFYEEYKAYGFEDRDLINSVTERFPDLDVRFLKDLCAYHKAETRVEVLLSKMYRAGRYTAPIYRSRFPKEYESSPYGRVDYQNQNYLARTGMFVLKVFLKVLMPIAVNRFDSLPLPYVVKKALAKFMLGTMFHVGTRDAVRNGSDAN